MSKLNVVMITALCIVAILTAIATWPVFKIVAIVLAYIVSSASVVLVLLFAIRLLSIQWYKIPEPAIDFALKREELRQEQEATTSAILDNQEKQLGLDHYNDVLRANIENGGIYVKKLLGTSFASLPGAVQAPHAYLESEPRPLLDVVCNLPRIVVVGGMGSGKTNTILHLAQIKSKTSEVHIFDSHSSPKKWPQETNVSVVGTGRDYTSIAESFGAILDLMDQRYDEIGRGIVEESTHPQITLLADEWTLLPEYVPRLEESARSLFTEGRKASIGFVIAVHALTVGALGLKGFSNLRESFDCIIYCEHDAQTNEYHTDVQWGWGTKRPRERMIPPPKYTPSVREAHVDTRDGDTEPVIIDLGASSVKRLPSIPSKDSIILDAFYKMVNGEETFSWNQLAIKLYGKRGGTYNDAIREVLTKYNVDFDHLL